MWSFQYVHIVFLEISEKEHFRNGEPLQNSSGSVTCILHKPPTVGNCYSSPLFHVSGRWTKRHFKEEGEKIHLWFSSQIRLSRVAPKALKLVTLLMLVIIHRVILSCWLSKISSQKEADTKQNNDFSLNIIGHVLAYHQFRNIMRNKFELIPRCSLIFGKRKIKIFLRLKLQQTLHRISCNS